MTTFDKLVKEEIFFENSTGEYYVKKSDTSAFVYDISEDCVFMVQDMPIQCSFPPDHPVETI